MQRDPPTLRFCSELVIDPDDVNLCQPPLRSLGPGAPIRSDLNSRYLRGPAAYQAVQEEDNTWSVVDVHTGMIFRVRGIPMANLTEDEALILTEILNDFTLAARITH